MHEENKLEKITKILTFIAGLSQLILSQVHIAAISKLFVREVGFYLFMFILLGIVVIPMVLAFEETRLSSYLVFLVTVAITIAIGIFTMSLIVNSLKDPQTTATMKDIQPTLILMAGGVILDFCSLVLIAMRTIGMRQGGNKHAGLAREQ